MTKTIEPSLPSEKAATEHTSGKTNKPLAKSLTIATFIMMASVLLSRIAGLVREQVLAYYGGTNSEMDAYVTAFLIPEILNHFLAGGFLSLTFIPIFQKHLLCGNRERAWKSFSNLMTIGSLFFLLLIPLTMIFTPSLLAFIGTLSETLKLPGKISENPAQLALTIRLTMIILPAQIFFYWGAFFSAVQMAEHKFFLPALAPLCYNIGIILGGVVLGPFIGIEGFAWGVLIGAFVSNVCVQLPGALQCGLRFRPIIHFSDPDFSNYIRKTVPLILGIGMVFSNEMFFRVFGALLPEGATSSLNYALRTMLIVVAVFGQASGVAFFPFLSKMAIEQQFAKMSEMLNTMLIKIAIFLIPLAGIMIVLAKPIISILYERGNFTDVSVSKTAILFSIYLIGSFAYSSSMIVSRMFYALQDMILPMIISTATALASIPAYLLFMKLFDTKGIAIAAILAMTIQFVILYFCWVNKYKLWKSAVQFIVQFFKILVTCCIGCGVGLFLKDITEPYIALRSPLISNFAICIIVSIPSLLAIFIIYELAGIQSLKATLRGLLRKGK